MFLIRLVPIAARALIAVVSRRLAQSLERGRFRLSSLLSRDVRGGSDKSER